MGMAKIVGLLIILIGHILTIFIGYLLDLVQLHLLPTCILQNLIFIIIGKVQFEFSHLAVSKFLYSLSSFGVLNLGFKCFMLSKNI